MTTRPAPPARHPMWLVVGAWVIIGIILGVVFAWPT
jgi:hypothetical protein